MIDWLALLSFESLCNTLLFLLLGLLFFPFFLGFLVLVFGLRRTVAALRSILINLARARGRTIGFISPSHRFQMTINID
jgi:hypothetical protein